MLFQLVSLLASQYVDNIIKNEKQQCQGALLKKDPGGRNQKI